jgi:hypothetical protein
MIVATLIAAGLVGATLFFLIVLIIAIVRLPVLRVAECRRGQIIKGRLDAVAARTAAGKGMVEHQLS